MILVTTGWLFTFASWKFAIGVEKNEIRLLTQSKLSTVQNLFKKSISERILSLERMAESLSMASYSLILMDCNMPEMDGFEATKRIRKLPGPNSQIIIIALTANAIGGDKEKCLAAGMNGYLTKPIEIEKLDAALALHIQKKRPV